MNRHRAMTLWFAVTGAAMLALTIHASLHEGILSALRRLWPDLWFRATLADAYFAFVGFWGVTAARHERPVAAAGWLAAFLVLGSMGMAAYGIVRFGRRNPSPRVGRP